ncbi:MAG: S8 family serine peptidase [Lewinellaceae bacterium]|nr:S8 family serine peptidase [Saprospiraceae bacterium]MCB9342183.1 S8 family serine peptidase [Lewinellaceae bacterium]
MIETFDWSDLLTGILPQSLIDNHGKNVKLALIDTGVNLNVNSLVHLDQPGHKFFVGRTGFSILDHTGRDPVTDGFSAGGHGTQLACIMSGKADSNQDHYVNGIANEADLTIIKARDISGAYTGIKHLLNSFELAADLGVEIAVTAQAIPLSRMIVEGITPAEVERVFTKVKDANMVILAAAENRNVGSNWTNLINKRFPNNQLDIMNVAAAPTDITQVRNQIANQKLQFLMGGFKGMVYDTSNRMNPADANNSCSVAILGGIAALCLSALKEAPDFSSNGFNGLLDALSQHSSPVSDANGNYPNPIIFKN